MTPINLDTLLLDVRRGLAAQRRLSTPARALEARTRQRESLEYAADLAARAAEKREALQRGLSSDMMDAARFRWLADHPHHLHELEGLILDEMRQAVDGWVRAEAVERLAEMRRQDAELRSAGRLHR